MRECGVVYVSGKVFEMSIQRSGIPGYIWNEVGLIKLIIILP